MNDTGPPTHLHALDEFSDWAAAAPAAGLWRRSADFAEHFVDLLDARRSVPAPSDVEVLDRWQRDGVDGEQVSWANPWGPRTEAFVLRPAGQDGPLPAALALHCHSNQKSTGKEHVADGPAGVDVTVRELRDSSYGGRAFANELARRGYVVLAHDTFGWRSRGLSLRAMGAAELRAGASPAERARHYDEVSRTHETVLAKICTVLGTSMAAVVLRDDRAALALLRARADVDADRTAVIGMSGGGCRAAMLQATTDVAACVVAAMMTTYAGLLDRHVAGHTWMFFPPGLATIGDWPDVASARAPSPLLVQYCADDELFSLDGMRAADERIRSEYERARVGDAYRAEWRPGGHRFDVDMQESAFGWLDEVLVRA
jgi:dienelactone hydrolase